MKPFLVSVDVKRANTSKANSFIAIDSVRLKNCAPGKYD